VWLVKTDDMNTGAPEILADARCPVLNAVHPVDPRAVARDVDVKERGVGRFHWILTVEYSSEVNGQTPNANPLMDPAKITKTTYKIQRPAWMTDDGAGGYKMFLNSAGEAYVPPIMAEVEFWTWSISKNLPFEPPWVDSLRNAVNSDPWTIRGRTYQPGQAKVDSIELTETLSRNDIPYVTLSIKVQTADAFKIPVPDMGYNELDFEDPDNPSSDLVLTPVTNSDGTRRQTPALLNGSGVALATPTPANVRINYLDWEPKYTFSVIPQW
jgi:hypothetical protein